MKILIELLTYTYLIIVPIISIISYIPQLRLLIKNKCSKNISISSRMMWSLGAIISSLYAILVVSDTVLIIVTSVTTFFCLLTTFLILKNQKISN